ncbi:MAG: flagellar hook protein FlgE [Pseudomonadota bacterium]
MSLFGMMRTGVSGMEGQAGRLSTIADNIANSATVGYKRFSTLLVTQSVNQPGVQMHFSGGVTAETRQLVSQQGVFQFTNSASDLAVNGSGFFVVEGPGSSQLLTRAGSFVPNAEGELVNAAGNYLLGYSFESGIPSPTANGFAGLERVRIDDNELVAQATDQGDFAFNLPSTAEIITGNTASANLSTSEFSEKTSVTVYDNLGAPILLDVYYTKTAANTWEVTVYNQADAAPDTAFPYANGPITTDTLTFDPSDGSIIGATPTLSIAVPGGATVELDMTGSSQLAAEFEITDIEVNGTAPSSIERVEFTTDGTMLAVYTNGTSRELFRVPLATVASPDNLEALTGNTFAVTDGSGDVRIGFPEDAGAGTIISGALETSTVDIAQELTEMIEAQRSYSANSKVFQTGSELTELVINLKR